MLEIGIFCVILLAAGYWVAMYVMGRHDDVIHGKFVHSQEDGEFAQAMPTPPPPFLRTVQVANELPADDAVARPVSSEACNPCSQRSSRT